MQNDLKNLEIMEKAQGLWPKSTPDQIALLTKTFSNVDTEKALGILDDAKRASRYQAIPFPDIEARTKKSGFTDGASDYIECWAVHQETKKFKTCCVLAQTAEGAKTMMKSYLRHRCRVEPLDYVLFIGKENFKAFWDYRMGKTEAPISEEF